MTPDRRTTAGRRYLELQRLARRRGRLTDELLTLYGLEGFLDRLTRSPYSERLVLKGGVLLAAFDSRRPTRDIDLAAEALDNDVEGLRGIVADISAIPVDDGLVFDRHPATAEVIREDHLYSGVRVRLRGSLERAELVVQVDINVGDPIEPRPRPVELPRLLGGELTVVGYGPEMILAEKIVTALERGTANTRWRDFVDIVRIGQTQALDGAQLQRSIHRVAEHRHAALRPLVEVLDGYPEIAQGRWAAWRRRQRVEDHTPAAFADLVDHVIRLADPVLGGTVSAHQWRPERSSWAPSPTWVRPQEPGS